MRFVQRTLWTSLLVSAWAVAPLLAQPATEPVVVIHAGALLDRPSQAPRGPSTIIVRGGRIEEVRDGYVATPDGARLIDLKGQDRVKDWAGRVNADRAVTRASP